MTRDKLAFNRTQLKEVFKDHKSIKEFERLLGLVDLLVPTTILDLELAAESADSKAQEALEALGRIASELEAIASAPAIREDNSVVTDYIDLPENGPHVTQERRVQWNSDDGTLDVGLYNGVVLQSGQELHIYAKNTSGVLVANGTAVMYDGTVGASTKLKFTLATADGTFPADYMLGIATQDIAINAFGYVTIWGSVRGFDTTGGDKTVPEVWADGDILYLDPAVPGELTKTLPTAPDLKLPIAVVLNAGANGSVYVRFKTGESIASLHDVYQPSIRDLDLLQYNTANGRWETGSLPWVDIDFSIIIRTTGAGIPILSAFIGNLLMPKWQINDFNMCESQEFIHPWKEGSECYWHIHLTTNGIDAGNTYVNFEVEYSYVNSDDDVWLSPSAVITSGNFLIPGGTPDKTMFIVPVDTFTPAAAKIGGHVLARLKRIANTAGAANPASDPWVSMLQMHVQIDTIGSRWIATK